MAKGKHFVEWKGATVNINRLAVLTDSRPCRLYHRILRAGMSPEDAVLLPQFPRGSRQKPKLYWFRGQRMSIKDAVRNSGISRSALRRRVFDGTILDGDELAEMRTRLIDYPENARLIRLGPKTQSLAEWARERSLPKSTLSNRLAAGWPLIPALFKPRRKYTRRANG